MGFIITIGLFIDQTSKHLAQTHLSEVFLVKQSIDTGDRIIASIEEHHRPTNTIQAIPNLLNLIYKENHAAAFSLTASWPDDIRKPFLIILSFLSIIFFVVWFLKASKEWLLLGSLALIITGAVGNFVDRITLGYVIDFIDFHGGFFGKPDLHFATFNIADSLICVGAFGIFLRSSRKHALVPSLLPKSDGHV